jgi:hypothetical protein
MSPCRPTIEAVRRSHLHRRPAALADS